MKKLYVILCILLLSTTLVVATLYEGNGMEKIRKNRIVYTADVPVGGFGGLYQVDTDSGFSGCYAVKFDEEGYPLFNLYWTAEVDQVYRNRITLKNSYLNIDNNDLSEDIYYSAYNINKNSFLILTTHPEYRIVRLVYE